MSQSRCARVVSIALFVAVLAPAQFASAQTFTIGVPTASLTPGNHAIVGSGLPSNTTFTFGPPGTYMPAFAMTDSQGVLWLSFDANAITLPSLPRDISLTGGGQVFTGTELDEPYPHVVPLSPFGVLVFDRPTRGSPQMVASFHAEIPAPCTSGSIFQELADGRIFYALDIGTAFTGSVSGEMQMPDAPIAAVIYQGRIGCPGTVLRGLLSGPPPATASLVAAPLEPFMTVLPTEATTVLTVRGFTPGVEAAVLVDGRAMGFFPMPIGADGSLRVGGPVPAFPTYPRHYIVVVGGQLYMGTEEDGPFEAVYGISRPVHVVSLQPSGTVAVEPTLPIASLQTFALPQSTDLRCSYSVYAVPHDPSDRVLLGRFAQDANGHVGNTTPWPEAIATAEFIWRPTSFCPSADLTAAAASGPLPWSIPLHAAPRSLGPNMSIATPLPYIGQRILGDGLPPSTELAIRLGATFAGRFISPRTDASGSFETTVDVTLTVPMFPRSDTIFMGPSTFVGTEAGGAHPKVVALAPAGTLRLDAPFAGQRTTFDADGLPADSCTYQLYLTSNGARTLIGSGRSFNGHLSVQSPFVPIAGGYEWAAAAPCTGKYSGTDPGDLFPRGFGLQLVPLDVTPPTVTVPATVVAEATGQSGALVFYAATAIDDVSGPVPTTCTPASGSIFPLGITSVACNASDAAGNVGTATFPVTVQDTTPPTILEATASASTLWPANHRMRPVAIMVSVTDLADPMPRCAISGIVSTEPETGLGDGDTGPDWAITGALTAQLRAERSGTGSGRMYTLQVACDDAAGNRATRAVRVSVPHDQGK